MENIKKKCTPTFHGTNVICYIMFKLLFKIRMVAFCFSFQI